MTGAALQKKNIMRFGYREQFTQTLPRLLMQTLIGVAAVRKLHNAHAGVTVVHHFRGGLLKYFYRQCARAGIKIKYAFRHINPPPLALFIARTMS